VKKPAKKTQLILALTLVSSFLWIPVSYSAEFKKTIAVSRFDVRVGKSTLGEGMSDMLADSLIQSGSFVVLERQTLEDIITEQDLAASGRAAVSKSAQTGKLIPSQILIKGTVTEFDEKTESSGTGIGFGGFNIGSSSTAAHVAVILRIIDTTSAEVLDSIRVEGKAEGSGLKLGGSIAGISLGTEGFSKTPLGKATQIAIDNAVEKIVARLQTIPFSGKIIKVSGDTIYTNLGGRNGVSVGDLFNVYNPGESLIDPDTGENLGSEKTKTGSLKINSVQEKFSKASAETGELFEKGFQLTE